VVVSEGDRLPGDLSFIDDEGGRIGSEELSRGLVVLYFYPRAMTPGCTREAIRFNELLGEFERCGARVYGASTDPPERNRRFKERHNLKFKLLSDPEGENAAKLGVLRKGAKRPSAERVTLIVRGGVVVKMLRNIRPAERHADEALKIVRDMTSC